MAIQKITDFWLSKDNIKGNKDVNSFCKTPEFLAPETSNPLF